MLQAYKMRVYRSCASGHFVQPEQIRDQPNAKRKQVFDWRRRGVKLKPGLPGRWRRPTGRDDHRFVVAKHSIPDSEDHVIDTRAGLHRPGRNQDISGFLDRLGQVSNPARPAYG